MLNHNAESGCDFIQAFRKKNMSDYMTTLAEERANASGRAVSAKQGCLGCCRGVDDAIDSLTF